MNYLITSITELLTLKGKKSVRIGKELTELGIIKDAAIYISEGRIKYYGKEKDVIKKIKKNKFVDIKAEGVVMPAFIDSHTHAVFARPRLLDFEMRTQGATYAEIKKAGGGINRSANDIKNSDIEELSKNLIYFSKKFLECGTATAEVKSGYGLDFENEIKILKTVKESQKNTPLEMVPTFLGAHSIPSSFKSSKDYLDYLKKEVVPYVTQNKLAVYADIFCEKGYFEPEEAVDYLNHLKKYGLKPRIHADQLTKSGGSVVANKVKAVSADHLDFADQEYIKLLKKSDTIATFLPASNYFLGLTKYPDARKFIENANPVSLATDFNPGTSPCWNMQFVISLALTHMKMRISEAIVSATYNAACALEINDRVGMIDLGMDADIMILEVKDHRELGYYFGANLNKITFKKGKIAYEKNNTFRH